MDTYDAYFEKVVALLGCEPERFRREYMLQRRGGEYKLVHRGKPLGRLALQGAAVE
jgi:hypothetical protein